MVRAVHSKYMDSRRNFIGKVATGLAGTLAAGSAEVLGAADRIRVGIIGAGDRGMELVSQIRACPNTEIAAFADAYSQRLERAQGVVPALGGSHRLSPPAGRRLARRRGDRDPAAPARSAILGRSRRRQARVSRKDHGVHGRSRQADARHTAEVRVEAHCPDRSSGLLLRPCERRAAVPRGPGPHGENHRYRHADAPQHSGQQAAVVAARADDSGSNRAERSVGGFPGRVATARPSMLIASCIGAISGKPPAATCLRA